MLLLKSVGRSLAVFLVVTFVAFCLMFQNGPGIARSTLGLGATPEAVQAQLVKLGLDRPLLVQYWDWLTSAVTGDLGRSFYTSESVSAALSNRVPVTLAIAIITLLLTAATTPRSTLSTAVSRRVMITIASVTGTRFDSAADTDSLV